MSEDPLLTAPERPQTATDRPPGPTGNTLLLCGGIGFLILAAAIWYVWQNPAESPQLASGLARLQAMELRVQAIDQRVQSLDARISRIEQMPAPPSAADLGKVSARIDALEGRVGDQAQIAAKIDQTAGRIEALSGRSQAAADALKQQMDTANSKIAGLQASSTSVATAGSRVDRLIRIQGAAVALENGRPLGTLPDAPPAVARFAEKPPPTEAQLRLAFAKVQRDALAASKVDTTERPFLERALGKAEELVTIRRGDDVVVGNSTAAALAQADAAVQAGDFPAALKAMGQLDPAAQKASADWVAQVRSLLDARAALVEMAARA
jgi:hypothetical protein